MSHTQGQHESVLIRRQEQTIPETARPPAGTAHALQERRDGRRRIDLNHAIKIANEIRGQKIALDEWPEYVEPKYSPGAFASTGLVFKKGMTITPDIPEE